MGRRKTDGLVVRVALLLAVLVMAACGLSSYVAYRAISAVDAFNAAMDEISNTARAERRRHRDF